MKTSPVTLTLYDPHICRIIYDIYGHEISSLSQMWMTQLVSAAFSHIECPIKNFSLLTSSIIHSVGHDTFFKFDFRWSLCFSEKITALNEMLPQWKPDISFTLFWSAVWKCCWWLLHKSRSVASYWFLSSYIFPMYQDWPSLHGLSNIDKHFFPIIL